VEFVGEGGRVELDDTDPDGQTLLVFYPGIVPKETDYVRSAVRIECGAKSALDPHREATIRPYVADVKKAPHAFRDINGQFVHEVSGEEQDNASFFEEEFNRWLSYDPLTNDEICQLMRTVERERKLEGKPPLVQFLPRSKRAKRTQKKRRSPLQPQRKRIADTRCWRQEGRAGGRACLRRQNQRP
jgi:hypothetical protein